MNEPPRVLPSLAIELALAESETGKVYPLLSGKLVKKCASGDQTVMVRGEGGRFAASIRIRLAAG